MIHYQLAQSEMPMHICSTASRISCVHMYRYRVMTIHQNLLKLFRVLYRTLWDVILISVLAHLTHMALYGFARDHQLVVTLQDDRDPA